MCKKYFHLKERTLHFESRDIGIDSDQSAIKLYGNDFPHKRGYSYYVIYTNPDKHLLKEMFIRMQNFISEPNNTCFYVDQYHLKLQKEYNAIRRV